MITLTKQEAQQPEALRLADGLERGFERGSISAQLDQAAAELRRLHEVNEILRAKLSEPEPVAKCTNSDSWNCKYCRKTETCAALKDPRNFGTPIKPEPEPDWMERERAVGYREGHQAALKQREWVSLTEEDIRQSYETSGHYQTLRPQDSFAVYALARAIEAKSKEKNSI
jgi:hypothetical protein